MKRLLKIGALLLLVAVLVSAMVAPSTALANGVPVQVQMSMCLDGSGSIYSSDFTLMKTGLHNAVNDASVVPRDGSVELSIVQFSYDAQVELAPTVVTDANLPTILAAIDGMTQLNSNTNLAAGINLCASLITGSSNFATAQWQVINITTDGAPNAGGGEAGAEAAVTTAVAGGVIDEIDIEGVGLTTGTRDWLAVNIAYPDGPGGGTGAIIPPDSYPPRPPDAGFKGFVRVCETYSDYVDAINEKFFQILVGQLTLNPPSATNPINTEHCVIAHLVDGNGDPVDQWDISFTVTGMHGQGPVVVKTDEFGDAEFCYTGTIVGSDTIVASCVDPEDDTKILTSREVYKDWTDVVPPPSVPSMTEWGIIALAIMLVALIPLALRRRHLLIGS